MNPSIHDLCELAQEALMNMRYIQSERLFESAEELALKTGDFDTLSRLYMPLQECRRQRRQRCGEGAVRFDLFETANQPIDARQILTELAQGQLCVAGWGSIQPAIEVRQLARERELYVETFLGTVYPIVGGSRVVVIVPDEPVVLPPPDPQTVDQLRSRLPARSILLNDGDLPSRLQRGTHESYGQVMALWERLHAPFLADGDAETDGRRKIQSYRKAITVDYACELAHQKLSQTARQLAGRRT